jgi:hypothetical protein
MLRRVFNFKSQVIDYPTYKINTSETSLVRANETHGFDAKAAIKKDAARHIWRFFLYAWAHLH